MLGPISFVIGFYRSFRRLTLTLLLFAVNFAMAWLVTLPIKTAFADILGLHGFGADPANINDIILSVDLFKEAGNPFGTAFSVFMWTIPIMLIWRAVSHAGLANVLHDTDPATAELESGGFWAGVGQYGRKSIIVTAMLGFATLIIIGIAGAIIIGATSSMDEIGQYNSVIFILPAVLIYIASFFAIWMDYARIEIVLSDNKTSVVGAIKVGFVLGIRKFSAWFLTIIWGIIGATLILLPTWIDIKFTTNAVQAVLIVFVLQQFVLLFRAWVTIAWTGSEVALSERLRKEAGRSHGDSYYAPSSVAQLVNEVDEVPEFTTELLDPPAEIESIEEEESKDQV